MNTCIGSATGRNGYFDIYDFHLRNDQQDVQIECSGKSGKLLNAGMRVNRDHFFDRISAFLDEMGFTITPVYAGIEDPSYPMENWRHEVQNGDTVLGYSDWVLHCKEIDRDNNVIRLTWEEFEAAFKPIKNHIDENASYDGYMFETYGKELEYVRSVCAEKQGCVWTLYCEGEYSAIQDGMHLVNRMGYFVTELPAAPDKFYIVDEDTWGDNSELSEEERAELEEE
jgi:hypothetical protein